LKNEKRGCPNQTSAARSLQKPHTPVSKGAKARKNPSRVGVRLGGGKRHRKVKFLKKKEHFRRISPSLDPQGCASFPKKRGK